MCITHQSGHDGHDGSDRTTGRPTESRSKPWYATAWGVGILLLAFAAGFYLWAEHRPHVLAYLPFALLLACPLLHLLMHRGHGSAGRGSGHDDRRE